MTLLAGTKNRRGSLAAVLLLSPLLAISALASIGDEHDPLSTYLHSVAPKLSGELKNSKAPEKIIERLKTQALRDPGNADAWYQLGDACFAIHDMGGAVSAYGKCVKLAPGRKEFWDAIGVAYNYHGEAEKAENAFQQALVLDPDYVNAMANLATVMITAGRLTVADSLLARAEKLDPANSKVWDIAGLLLNERKQWREAVAAFDKAIELKPDNIIAIYNRGCAQASAKNYPAAISDFEKVTKIQPSAEKAWAGLMAACFQGGDMDAAIEQGCRAVRANPASAVLWNDLGQTYVAKRDGLNAEMALKISAALGPGIKETQHYLGAAYYLNKQYPEAEAALLKATAADPKDGWAWLNLGRTYFAQSKYQKALGILQKACDLMPAETLPRVILGGDYLVFHQFDKAKASLDEAMRMGDNTAQLWFTYGELYALENKKEESFKALKAAAGITQNSPFNWSSVVDSAIAAGHTDEALDALRKLIQLQPDNAQNYVTLGRLYHLQNKETEANAAYQKALSLNPQNKDSVPGEWDKSNKGQNVRMLQAAALLNAKKSFTKDELARAGNLLNKALEFDPKNSAALRMMAVVCNAEKNEAEAARLYGEADKIDPSPDPIKLAWAAALAGSGKYDEAGKLLDEIMPRELENPQYWLQYLNIFAGRGKIAGAPAFFQQQAAKHPGNSAILLRLGDAQLMANDRDGAEASLKKAYEIKNDDPAILHDYGVLLMMRRDIAGAFPLLKRAAELSSAGDITQTSINRTSLGEACMRSGKLHECEEICEKVVAAADAYSPAWQLLLACYKSEGRESDVARCRDKLEKLGVKESPPTYQLVNVPAAGQLPALMTEGESMEAYHKLADKPGAAAQEWYDTGVALLVNKKFTEAEAAFRKYTELAPGTPNGWLMLGAAIYGQNKFQDALPFFQKAREIDRGSARIWGGLAACYEKLHLWAQAEAAALNTLSLDPKDQVVWHTLMFAYMTEGKTKEMEEQVQKEEAIYPSWGLAVYWQGIVLKIQGRTDEARAAFEKSIEMNPKAAILAWLELGKIYGEGGHPEKSLEPFRKVTELDPSYTEGWNCLGYSNFLLGNDAQAVEFYNKSIACYPTATSPWINLARLYGKENKAAKAAETCDKIERFNPALANQLRAELKIR